MRNAPVNWVLASVICAFIFLPTTSFSQEPFLNGIAAPLPENAAAGDVLRLKEAGIEWAYLPISRTLTETAPGRYDASPYEAVLKAALKHDVGLIIRPQGSNDGVTFKRWARKAVIDIRRRGVRRVWEIADNPSLLNIFKQYFSDEMISGSSPYEETLPRNILSADEEARSREISRALILNRAKGATFDRLPEWNESGDHPRKPSFYAVRAFMRFLNGHRFAKRLKAGSSHIALLFENEKTGKASYAVWTDGETQEAAVPVEPGEYALLSHRGTKIGSVTITPEESGAILPLDNTPKYLIPSN